MPQYDNWVTEPPTRIALPLRRFHCTDCNYGASRRTEPLRCPMCGGASWAEGSWDPSEAESPALLPGVPLS